MQDFQSFPPFYTKQPTLSTYEKQKELWLKLILDSCKSKRSQILAENAEIFENKNIDRKLDFGFRRELMDCLVKQGRGEWITKTEIIAYYYTIQEWANFILKWVRETGKMGSIVTLYEIVNEDSQEFSNADERVIKKALELLQKQGKASLFASEDGNTGVKFV